MGGRWNMREPMEILERLKILAGVKQDKDFAEFLKLPRYVIANWRRLKRVDYETILSRCEAHNFDVQDVIYGKNFTLVTELQDELLKTKHTAEVFERLYKETLTELNKIKKAP